MSATQATGDNAKAPAKKSRKLLFIIVGVTIALAGGGGYFYMAKKKAEEAKEQEEGGGAKEVMKAPIFVPLDPFTVNLSDTLAERMAQIAVTFQIKDPKTADSIKLFMPAIRNNVLKVISSKESKEILTIEGKEKLAIEIANAAAKPLGWFPEDAEEEDEKPAKLSKGKKQAKRAPPPNPIEDVHFSQFIIQ